jgi:ribonuclease HII
MGECLYRYEPEHMCVLENLVLGRGFSRVAGIDEAGRGALAGPVVAACVILDERRIPARIVDSKKITDRRRRELSRRIMESAVAVGVGVVDPAVIDEVNIYNATILAMKRAVSAMPVKPDFLLIDAVKIYDISISSLSFVKGEDKSVSVAAASIIAKVCRDDIMMGLSEEYPEFGFCRHKGYGTALHTAALRTHGPTEVHRYSYQPVRDALNLWKSKNQTL